MTGAKINKFLLNTNFSLHQLLSLLLSSSAAATAHLLVFSWVNVRDVSWIVSKAVHRTQPAAFLHQVLTMLYNTHTHNVTYIIHCQLVPDEGRRQLRSANSRTCVVRRTYSSYADRCFAAAGPKLWNCLPAHLRQTDINFEQFKRLLKTFLFGCWDRGALWLTVKSMPLKFSCLLIAASHVKQSL